MFFFFFKQKTAYEMRISDWSSDVCSSDLFLKVAIADRIATIPSHRPQDHITLEMAPLEIRHRSVRPISAKHAQASRFLQQSRLDSSPAIVSGIPVAAFLSDSANSYFGASPPRIREEPSRKRHGAPALYSCIISAELDRGHIHVFGAMIARSASEVRSEEHTSELQSLMSISYAV